MFGSIRKGLAALSAWKRLKEASMKGHLKTAVFGLVGAVVTAVVAAVTSKCPELLPSLSAVGTAAIGGCWAYLRTKEKPSQSVVMGVLAAGFAAGLGQIKLVCGDQFITTLPSVATAGVWVGLMAWLKSPKEA